MTQALTEISPISDADFDKLRELFEPLNDVVVVAVDTAEKKTPGGIILPEATTNKLTVQSGTVICVGPGAVSPVTADRVALSVDSGDRVLFGQYAGNEVVYGDVTLKMMREADVMTVVKDDDALQPESVRIKRGGKAKRKAKTSD